MEFFGRIRERMERSLVVARECGIEVAKTHSTQIGDFIERLIFGNVKTIRIVIDGDSHIRISGSNKNSKEIHKNFYFEHDYFGNKTTEQNEAFRKAYCEQLKIELPEIGWKDPKNSVDLIAVVDRDDILKTSQMNCE